MSTKCHKHFCLKCQLCTLKYYLTYRWGLKHVNTSENKLDMFYLTFLSKLCNIPHILHYICNYTHVNSQHVLIYVINLYFSTKNEHSSVGKGVYETILSFSALTRQDHRRGGIYQCFCPRSLFICMHGQWIIMI